MTTATELVERFLEVALGQRFDRLPEVLDEEFVIVEPTSLPYGGEYRGPEGYARFFTELTAVFEITAFDVRELVADGDRVVMKAEVGFRSRKTGRGLTMPVLELLEVAGGKLARSEVYFQDTAALLELLDG